MARTVLAGALVCLALALASAASAQDPRKESRPRKEYSISLDQQPLTKALEHLYDQTGVFYGYSPSTAEEERMLVGPLRGKLTIEEALNRLLQSTGLTFEWTDSKNIAIVRAPPPPPKLQAAPQTKTPRTAQAPVKRATAREMMESDGILETIISERQRVSSSVRASARSCCSTVKQSSARASRRSRTC